jgi:hypothetical protein
MTLILKAGNNKLGKEVLLRVETDLKKKIVPEKQD